MIRAFIVAVIFSVSAVLGAAMQTSPTAPKKGGNPEAAKITNPVASTPESIAAGKRVYARLCSRCHGSEGKGDGAAGGTVQPSDLSDDRWDYGSSDGEIFSAIHDGTSTDMEGYAQRISDTDIWNIVNFLRSLGPQK
jgi:mono/diheme cytochrome c family protein